ncbi:MAG: hybrid sensor histidine kinase/response regulator [Sphingobacteriales bacterium]|nr:MAG: hybrid sensor histidine kinase/response regulator [Sphingobacteriales bacterium]
MNRPNSCKILIVDDDEDDFFIVSELIRMIPSGEYTIEWASRYEDAIREMMTERYDVYFVDYRLGARSGMELLKEAIQNGCEKPIILLTGGSSTRTEHEALQSGAVDYLIKADVTSEKLERAVRYAQERTVFVKALRANERKYRAIFEHSKDLVFLVDETLQFKDVNPAVTQLLQYDKDVILSKTLFDLLEEDDEKEGLQQQLRMGDEIRDLEITVTTGEGAKKQFQLSLTTQEAPMQEHILWQGILHDITSLRKAEKATLQAEKLAATGRLVRTLAHEVRNPLNNITLSVEQIQADVVPEGMELYLNIIQRNSKRISDLISELLNSSRPTEIVMKRVPLQSVIDEVINQAADRLKLKNIRFDVGFPPTPVWVNADVEKLSIALLNIVINASEAMEEQPGGHLQMQLTESKDQAHLVIADNGCGIPEENVSRLFEPYFTQKRNGMGLGLASTLNIIQAHKGNIEVSSEVGEGTSFTILLPIDTNPEG